MKKNFSMTLAALAAFATVLSCTKVEEPGNNYQDTTPAGQVTISATLSDALTKVSFTPSYGTDGKPESLALAWAEGDKLRVYDHADKTTYADFELAASSVGQKTGIFTGTLPVAQSYDVEVVSGEVDYAVQTQPADGETTSLKYLASATELTDVSAIEFTDYSSVLAITAKMPEGAAAAVSSVSLTASEAIFSTGKSLTISLAQKGDAGNDGILHLFATLPQGDVQIAEGTTLLVRFNAPGTDHTVYTRFVELGPQAFAAGKLNTISINASESDVHAGLVSCDGTSAEKAYLVGDKYQMQAMGSLMTAEATTYFRMVDDVDLTGVDWTPLNNASPYDKGINFDGGNHTVSNLTTNESDTRRNSAFAAVLVGNLCNVTFDKASIEPGTSYCAVVASHLGYDSNEGSCQNVVVSNSNVTSAAISGGFASAGQFIGSVTGCKVINTSVTSSSARVGGFIGSVVEFDEISDCCAENVTVKSDSYSCAGFVGQLSGSGTVTGCHATGTVDCGASSKSYSFAGGLIGDMASGTVENSYSTCSVGAKGKSLGGLIGTMQAGTVSGCYASGDVNAVNYYSGGLIGAMATGSVTECYATGNVTSTSHYSGGLVGHTTGDVEISQCYATGTLGTTQNRKGGIVGNVTSGTTTVSNCYATCNITCKSYSGCFIGGVESGATLNVTNSYSKSTIAGHEDAACVFTGLASGTITCTGFVGWNLSNRKNWSYNVTSAVAPTGNYMGTEGTISAKAKEYKWDETIWDLSGDEPKLR